LSSPIFFQTDKGVVAPQGATVEGECFDTKGNLRIPGVEVSAPSLADPSTKTTATTDGSGHYKLTNVMEGDITVSAHKFGCAPNSAVFDQGYYREKDGGRYWSMIRDWIVLFKSVSVLNVKVNQPNPASEHESYAFRPCKNYREK